MRVLAFDTETRGLDWFDPDQRAFLVTWATSPSHVYDEDIVDGRGERFLAAIRTLRSGDRIWGHNLKFDLHHVRAQLGLDLLAWAEATGVELWDTDTLDRVLNPTGQRKDRGGHGLKALDELYLDGMAAEYEEQLKELADEMNISLKTTPQAYYRIYQHFPDEMRRYARYDAECTWRLGEEILLPQLQQATSGQQRVAALERRITPILTRAEQRGVKLDTAQVQGFKRQFETERDALRFSLELELGEAALGGPGSEEALREALQMAGVELVDRTPSGKISTAKPVLQQFEDQHPVVRDLMELRRVERFLNTYIGPMVGREVIHTDFQQCEAWTGRMSSRRPNMQNWPQRAGKEVRNVLTARDGCLLVTADFSQMEAMIVVRYLNNPALIDAINDGLDMNAWMAAQIWGGMPEDWDKNGPRAEGERSRKTARHTLYATLYGAGARRVNQQLPFLNPGPFYRYDDEGVLRDERGNVVPQRPWKDTVWPQAGWQYDEARQLIRKVKTSLPGYYDFTDRLADKVRSCGHVNTILGRCNPVGVEKLYVAVAAIVQGTGADLLKLAAAAADPPLRAIGGTLVMFTHDELVVEVPEARAEQAKATLEDAMANAYPDHNPRLKASASIVKSYGEA